MGITYNYEKWIFEMTRYDKMGYFYPWFRELLYILTRILPFKRCDSQVLADLLLQHVVLSRVIWGPLVLCEVLCWEVCQAGTEEE